MEILRADCSGRGKHDFIADNPSYVAITGLTEGGKRQDRAGFATGYGRFDL